MDYVTWAEARGISKETLDRCGVGEGKAGFPEGVKESIVFHYFLEGESVNYKARAIDEKLYKAKSGGTQCFYNIDSYESGTLYVTEGEIDCLSLVESKIEGAVSIPFGAPAKRSDCPQDQQRYQFIVKMLSEGFLPPHVVFVGDNDEPGMNLIHDLAALFGPGRCAYVKWPKEIKDANDFLQQWGGESLREFIFNQTVDYPLEGVFSLSEIGDPPDIETWHPGFHEWEQKVLLSPGMMSVATGFPGHGKTHLWQQIWFQIAKTYGIRVAIMSAETRPKPHVLRNMRQFYHGIKEFDQTDEQREEADEWIEENIKFIIHPNARPTFRWMMDQVENAWARHGVRAVCIDPWNKLESDRGTQRETEWIGDCLDVALDCSRDLNMHFQIIAHPSKPESQDKKNPPDAYSISGSSHWNNRPDQIFSTWRPHVIDDDGNRCTEAVFYHLKARFEESGYPCKLAMRFLPERGIFKSADFETIMDGV